MFFMLVDFAYNIVHRLVWCWLCGTIDKQGGEGLETHCTYICTLTVIGVFL